MATETITETVYCVKYALTQGIFLITGYQCGPGRFVRNEDGYFQSFTKTEWSRNGEEALELANEMKHRKIKSLGKQRDKLLQMGFELPPKFEVVGTKTGRLPG